MLNCYWQIFITYFTKTAAWPLFVVLLIAGMMMPLLVHDPQRFGIGGIFIVWYFMAITAHLREQISRPEATVIPRYRVLHLLVAATLLLPILLLTAFIASIGYHVSFLPVMSGAFASFALLTWLIYRPSTASAIVAAALWCALFSETVSKLLVNFLNEPPAFVVVALLTVGTVGLAMFVRDVMSLTEESPEYARGASVYVREDFSVSGFKTPSKINYGSRWQHFFSAASDRAIERIIASPNRTFLQRLARSRAPTRIPGAMPLLILICAGGLFLYDSSDSNSKSVPIIWIVLWLLPASAGLVSAFNLHPTLAYESLRPITRRQFLRERGLILWLRFSKVWLALAATLVVAAILSTPQLLISPAGWLYLAASYVAPWAMFAASLWLLHFTTEIQLFMPIFGLPFLAMFLGFYNPPPKHYADISDAAGILCFIAIAFLLGTIILYDAYRRWLITDLA